jgi:hypothetical protein
MANEPFLLCGADLEHSLKEAVLNLFSWIQNNQTRGIEDLMEKPITIL